MIAGALPTTADAQRRTRPVPAVTRAVAILRLLGRSDQALGVKAIAHALDLVPSTCLHILRVLVGEGLVAFDAATKRYHLDAGILTLARGALRRNGFAETAQAELDALSRRHGVTAIAVQVTGLERMVVVAISRSDEAVRLHVDVGSRFPALTSAAGRCVAAFNGHAWSDLEPAFRALRWDRAPSPPAWRAEVAAAAAAGYAVDDGNYLRGVTAIAAPVRSASGEAQHVLVVVGVREQIRRIGVEGLARELCAVAGALARRLGAA